MKNTVFTILMCLLAQCLFAENLQPTSETSDTMKILSGVRQSYETITNEYAFYEFVGNTSQEVNTKGFIKQQVKYDLSPLGIADFLEVTIMYDAKKGLPYSISAKSASVEPSFGYDDSSAYGYDEKLRSYIFTMPIKGTNGKERFKIQICQ